MHARLFAIVRINVRSSYCALYVLLGFTLHLLSAAPQRTPTAIPTFDAVSVKPASSLFGPGTGRKGPPPFTIDPKHLAVRRLTLKQIISRAWGTPESQVSGGPGWIENDRYDIDATTESAAGKEQMMIMLRAAVTERFHLQFHRETKGVLEYALMVAKNGPKYGPHLHQAEGGAPPGTAHKRPGEIPLYGKSMKDLAYFLSDNRQMWDPDVGSQPRSDEPPVLDETGLPGQFDIVLTYAPRRDWLTTFERDLGLKLQPRKIPSEIFVIDGAGKPAAN